jgi:hypothetical protein
MACTCEMTPCRCQRFAEGGTLPTWLSGPVDAVRNVMAQLGMRPYGVKIVHVRWTGATVGDGREEVVSERPVLPVPAVGDLAGLVRQLTAAQVDDMGTVVMSEISAAYTEDDVLLRPRDGKPLPANEAVYYEIRWAGIGKRHRFAPVGGSASFKADTAEWVVTLTLQKGARPRSGAHR